MTYKEELELIIKAFKEQQRTIDRLVKAVVELEVFRMTFPVLGDVLKSAVKQTKAKQKSVKKTRPKNEVKK